MVSGTQLAFNGGGALAVTSGTVLNLSSGYFTGVWNDGLVVTVTGYRKGILVGTDTFAVVTSGPTLENLNLNGIDTADFTSTGGVPNRNYIAYGGGTQFALDNLAINASVPEPVSSATLVAAGLGMLLSRRRSRALGRFLSGG